MAKVLRLQEDGNNNLQHWQDSNAYGKTAIQSIIDGNGDAVSRQITSIPSPFARFDLLKVAFEYVNNSKDINGNTIYHKMVSDCLDIAELFFDFDKFSKDFNIIAWDIATNLQALRSSTDAGHKQLGDTLKLFFDQDAKANNFDDIRQIFLLDYKHGKNKMNIIGGTSPVTLFSTTANNYQGQINVFFGNRRIFDGICPLNKRQFGFQEYMYALLGSIPNGNTLFSAIYDYLYTINFPLLTNDEKTIIKQLDPNTIKGNSYKAISVDGGNNDVEVLGNKIYSFKINVGSITDNSEFVIMPNIISASSPENETESKQLPLILPIDKITNDFKYVTANWDRNKVAPYFDTASFENRVLPHDGAKYPYYTISDMLEENIICLPFPINNEVFFNGNFTSQDTNCYRGYLLPIKAEFFKYFTQDFLEGSIGGRNILEIAERGQGDTLYVDVTLRIPIKGDGTGNSVITYQRTYVNGGAYNTQQADLKENKGAIFNYSCSIALTSLVKYIGKEDKHFYRIGFFDNDTVNSVGTRLASLDVLKGGNYVEKTAVKKRQVSSVANSTYYVIEKDFDIIQLNAKNAKGVILPKWIEKRAGNVKYSFAVDFGTTNTHIEYKSSIQPIAVPFDVTSRDIQLVKLHKLSAEQANSLEYRGFENVFYQELMPTLIHKEVGDSFPQRTALTHHINMNPVDKNYALADFNIPFYYEKNIVIGEVNTLHTNLKWTEFGANQSAQGLVEGYLENLVFMMYNKVVLNGGDTSNVEIKWLYPTSMSTFNKNQLASTWSGLYAKYFGSNVQNLQEVTEALAPYNYYTTQGVQSMSNSVVSIDIGGGTTDVVVFTNNQPNILSSFKFAANNLFGDAINTTSSLNGYVCKYNLIYDGLLDRRYKDIGESILATDNSADYISFLFSLERDKNFNSNHAFTKLLYSDTELKVGPLLFFSSIIYYIAKMMKEKNVISPQYFTFSGTGSKLINILDASPQKGVVSTLISGIFQDIYGDNSIRIQVRVDEQVKEISCKGALIDNSYVVDNTILREIKSIYDFSAVDAKDVNYSAAEQDEYINRLHREYINFIEWFFAFDKKFNYEDNFGISSGALPKYKENLLQNAIGFLKLEVNSAIKSQNGNKESKLSETLFFYPLKGTINQLLYAIASGNLK